MKPIHFEDYLEYLYVTGQLEEQQTLTEEEIEDCQEEDAFVYVKKDVEHEGC